MGATRLHPDFKFGRDQFRQTAGTGRCRFSGLTLNRPLKEAQITHKVGWHTFRNSFSNDPQVARRGDEDGARTHAARPPQHGPQPLRTTGSRHRPQSKVARLAFAEKGETENWKSLLDLFAPAVILGTFAKFFRLLASPTGLEPVLSP